MKKILIFISILFSLFSLGFAQSNIDWFLLETNPETFEANEAVDLTITAIKDGEVYEEYLGSVVMLIKELTTPQYEVPASSIYDFKPSDLWSVTFPKWLIVHQNGTYTLKVDDITWVASSELTLIVWDSKASDKKTIDIISPNTSSIEVTSNIDVIWSSTDLPNTEISIYLNNQLVGTTNTNGLWDFSVTINEESILKTWSNILYAKAFDINSNIIWESENIDFSYEPIGSNLIEELNILPSNEINFWEKFTIKLTTIPEVSSAIITLSNNRTYPMDLTQNWQFETSFTANFTGNVSVSANLFSNWQEYKFLDLETLTVNQVHNSGDSEAPSLILSTDQIEFPANTDLNTHDWDQYIKSATDAVDGNLTEFVENDFSTQEINTSTTWEYVITYSVYDRSWNQATETLSVIIEENPWFNLKIQADPESIDWTSIILSWSDLSDSWKYKLSYWTGKNTLSNSIDLDTNEIIIQNLNLGQDYYFQVVALDSNNHEVGEKSDIIEYSTSAGKKCIIWDIKINLLEEDDKFFLIRDDVEWAVSYEIYRSDFKLDKIVFSDMNKVHETGETKFEYPFDPDAEQEEYAYYAVRAICEDWSTVQIDDVKEVQVWPMDNLILVIIISFLWFAVFKIYKETES